MARPCRVDSKNLEGNAGIADTGAADATMTCTDTHAGVYPSVSETVKISAAIAVEAVSSPAIISEDRGKSNGFPCSIARLNSQSLRVSTETRPA